MPRPGLRPRPSTPTTAQLLSRSISSFGRQTKAKNTSKEQASKLAIAKHISVRYEDPDVSIKQEIKLEEGLALKSETSEDKSELKHRENWREVYRLIDAYRKDVMAPVDNLGCATLGRKEFGEKVFRFETLVALILSAQLSDVKLAPTMRLLQSHAPNGLTPDALIAMGSKLIMQCLSGIGIQERKTEFLLGTSQICKDEYDGDIPQTFDALRQLPGVGPKIAALTMSIAWGKDVAIAVDTHVNRISQRLGWARPKLFTEKTKPTEETREELEEWLPSEYWGSINPLLVGFGQMRCAAIKPQCEGCPVEAMCPRVGVKIRRIGVKVKRTRTKKERV